jgi:hypothetical protein
MAKTVYHHATFSEGDLDFLLGFDPEVHPADDIHEKLANYRRYVNTAQSIIDDALGDS